MNVIERMNRARATQHAKPVLNSDIETLDFILDRAERLAKAKEPVTVESPAPVETFAARQARLLAQMEAARPKP